MIFVSDLSCFIQLLPKLGVIINHQTIQSALHHTIVVNFLHKLQLKN